METDDCSFIEQSNGEIKIHKFEKSVGINLQINEDSKQMILCVTKSDEDYDLMMLFECDNDYLLC